MKIKFDADWLFHLGDINGAQKEDFDDSAFRKLKIPHDWSIEGEFSRKQSAGRRCGFLPTGIGWYRKKFDVLEEWMERDVSILFDGIYMNSEIWLNGICLGFRPYGYMPVQYDITKYLKKGQNVIAVKVDNTQNPSSRWYNGSGIYRHAWLIVKENIHLDEEKAFIYATGISEHSANLHVEYVAANNAGKECQCTAVTRVYDKCGTIMISEEIPLRVPEASFEEVKRSFAIENPMLWSPEDPYLYKVEISLQKNGTVIDVYTCNTGIRNIEFHPQQGMFLNGKSIKLKGVCLHHDAGALGAAVPDKVLKSRLTLLKEMGCNSIRTSHNPFAPEFYDFCDELGIMVMNEIFDGWHRKAEFDYGGLYFDTWWRQDVTDFVNRDKNHPCVILWSIGNETGKDDIHGITELFHQLDPTRKVTGGEVYFGVDIAGFNGVSEVPGNLEKFKLEHPDKCIVLTEVPHTYQTRGFYRTKKWFRDHNRPVHDVKDAYYEEIFDDYSATFSHAATYNSSYDTDTVRITNRDCWARTQNTDYIIGQFMWTGIDYLGESFGWPYRSGNNGTIDLAGFPKDIYYFYQSVWTDKPMVHILPHWTHSFEKGKIVPVWVYTNCDSVELFLNGASLGTKRMKGVMNLEWLVPYIEGEIKAVGRKGDIEVIEKIYTSGEPCSFKTVTDSEQLKNDSVDITSVTVSVTDTEGNFVPYADNNLFFFIEGAARLRGAENGDPTDLEPAVSNRRKAFNGLCKAYVESMESQHEGAVAVICGIMGRTYFKELTTVEIEAKQVMLQQGLYPQSYDIYYTLDGTEPTTASEKYCGSFIIDKDTVVRALVTSENYDYLISQEFHKGIKGEHEKAKSAMPLSKKIIGKWMDEDGEVYDFTQNGVLNVYDKEQLKGEFTWWYEDPIDEFENEQADIDNGEVNFTFKTSKLRLQMNNLLRVKDIKKPFYLTRI